ncbi:MAG TPA: GNVR domain-containing protein [Parasulfuritortus sp.]
MATEYELTLNDYLLILRRRALHIFVAFAVIFAIAAIAAVVIPPVYESSGTILVESSDIPTNLVPDAVPTYVSNRLDVIQQRVMTRDNLLKIIDKYQLFKDQNPSMTTTELLDRMRDAIGVEIIDSNMRGNQRGMSTIAFKVSFDYRYPDIANKVANDLVTLFLNENAKSSTERAAEATKFLSDEANTLNTQLVSIENQVAAYKAKYANSLPENQELRQTMLQRAQSDLADVERQYKTTQDNLSFLEIQLTSAKAGVGVAPASGTENPVAELQSLRAQYASMSATYTENYPDVIALKRKIKALEKTVNASSKNGPASAMSETDLMVAQINAKIKSGNSQLTSLLQQAQSLRGQIAQLERGIADSPQVAMGLASLMRDYDNAQKKYDDLKNRQMSAQMAQNLQEQNKGERFSLIDPPLMPDKPIKPNRYKILILGFFLAIAGSGGMAMMLESFDKRVRGADALALIMNQRPLVSIPFIATQENLVQRKSMTKYAAAAAVALLFLVAIAVHIFYMPLDILFFKIMGRLG